MDTTTIIKDHRLLDHPFYRRWEDGKLVEGELASYAAQYRFFEAQLPSFLEGLAGLLDEGTAKELVVANLNDEINGAETHVALFERFATAVDAPGATPSPAMAALVATYREALAANDASLALGVLAGYEIQAAEVAKTKGEGLTAHYGVDETGAAFWNLHATLEEDHAAWTLEAAASLDEASFEEGVRRSSMAWWNFLDEREALVAA